MYRSSHPYFEGAKEEDQKALLKLDGFAGYGIRLMRNPRGCIPGTRSRIETQGQTLSRNGCIFPSLKRENRFCLRKKDWLPQSMSMKL
jgi:hypothetical protein